MFDNSRDRRVLRTRASLHEALARLIHDKPYADISVGDILERANVGRSTFYMHFTGKDDLLASAIEEMLLSMRPETQGLERIVGFARPVLEHIHRSRSVHGALASPRTQAHVHERLRKALTASIGEGVREECGGPAASLLAGYVAATFLLVLEAWVRDPGALPVEADAMFRALVMPTLKAAQRRPERDAAPARL